MQKSNRLLKIVLNYFCAFFKQGFLVPKWMLFVKGDHISGSKIGYPAAIRDGEIHHGGIRNVSFSAVEWVI